VYVLNTYGKLYLPVCPSVSLNSRTDGRILMKLILEVVAENCRTIWFRIKVSIVAVYFNKGVLPRELMLKMLRYGLHITNLIIIIYICVLLCHFFLA
jgi:hypothetical protein